MIHFPEWPLTQGVGNGEYVRLEDDYQFEGLFAGEVVRFSVRTGFEFNFSSTPRAVWSLVSPYDLGPGATFHDWLYNIQGAVGFHSSLQVFNHETQEWENQPYAKWSRKKVDQLFRLHMRMSGVAGWRWKAAYRVVRWFGGWG